MGMPITVEIGDDSATEQLFSMVFAYFKSIDDQFSPYKLTSEITRINNGLIQETDYSAEMKSIFNLCEETKLATSGYFDIRGRDGRLNPSGIVKGWSIFNAAQLLQQRNVQNFYIDAGGDIEAQGANNRGEFWKVGICNPFNQSQIVKIVYLKNQGIATSGTYIRGQHVYNPHNKEQQLTEIVSLTVIGPNVYEADRFATAAFAMGREGINFIEQLPGFEGYQIDKDGIATMTSHFDLYTKPYV